MKARMIMAVALSMTMLAAAQQTMAQSRGSQAGGRQARTTQVGSTPGNAGHNVGAARPVQNVAPRTFPAMRRQHVTCRPVASVVPVHPWAVGTVVSELPEGFTTIVIDGRNYYAAWGMTFEAVVLDGLLHFRVVA